MTPLVSVIVPNYNQAQYLDECLQSVLEQTYQNWECIIVNDGSPDNTEEVAKKWTEKDARFKYLKKENGGLSSARNAGIEAAQGEWILPLDADDKIGNRYLELAEKEFGKHDLVYCNAELFGEKTGYFKLPEFNYTTMAIQNTIFCSAFFKRIHWQKYGGYDKNLLHGYEDWDFWLTLISHNIKITKLDETLFFYRIKKASMTTNFHDNLVAKNKTYLYIASKHCNFISSQNIDIQRLLLCNEELEKKVTNLNQQLYQLKNSKRFIFINKIIDFLEKLKIWKAL